MSDDIDVDLGPDDIVVDLDLGAPLDDGDYLFRVDSALTRTSQAGNRVLGVQLEAVDALDPDGESDASREHNLGKTAFANFAITKEAMVFIYRFLKAINPSYEGKVRLNPEELVGELVIGKVTNQNDGNVNVSNYRSVTT